MPKRVPGGSEAKKVDLSKKLWKEIDTFWGVVEMWENGVPEEALSSVRYQNAWFELGAV